MTHEERVYFLDREVKGLWPQWDATDAELRVWKDSLAPFDYVPARAAIQACFREQAVNYQRPVLSKFLAHLRTQSRRATGPAPTPAEPTTEVFLECLEPPRDKPHLAGARKPISILPAVANPDPERLRTAVEPLRVRFEQLYGGRWITVLTVPRPDDGLCGEPAQRRAYDLIFTGPDTPTRRCLLALFARRTKPWGTTGLPTHALPRDEPTAACPSGGRGSVGPPIIKESDMGLTIVP